jgi:Domain of unknown function (DUF6647)
MWKASLCAAALLTMTMAGSLCAEDPASFPSIRPQTDGTEVRAKAHFRPSRNPPRQVLAAIEAWLSTEFDLPTIHEHPFLRFVPAAKIAALRYRGLLSAPGTGFAANDQQTAFAQGDMLALYDDATHTIYLPEGWKGSTPVELSLLVHEMVHHFQNELGLKHECPQQREKLAYVAQDHWLGLFGHSLADDFGLDAFSLLVKTTCFY